MRLIDTSAWIEWLIGSPTGRAVAGELPERAAWVVPTIVQLELAKWLTRERSEDEAERVIAFTQFCVVAPLDTRTALIAAEQASARKLATADAIVYATALEYRARLVTCDADFLDLPQVTVIDKRRNS
jgi:predicted nucleic acid-binding protein